MSRVVFVRIERRRAFMNVGLHELTDAELEQVAARHDALEGWRWARRIAGELADKPAPPPQAGHNAGMARMSTSADRLQTDEFPVLGREP